MDKKQWLQSVGMRDPIELAFSKLKAHLKRLAPRTVEALWKNTGADRLNVHNTGMPKLLHPDGYAPK